MVDVLVGGKPRKTVLEDHLRNLQDRQYEPTGQIPNLLYKRLEWQILAAAKDGIKHEYSFDIGDCSLIELSFDRPPTPAEAFSLIIDGLYSSLPTPELKCAYQNLIQGAGEWLDAAVKPEGGILSVYEHPRDLLLCDEHKPTWHYDAKVMRYDKELAFELNGIPLEQAVSLKDVAKSNPELVTYLFSIPFEFLPLIIKEEGAIRLPAEGCTGPLALSNERPYELCAMNKFRAIRGVNDKRFSGGDLP